MREHALNCTHIGVVHHLAMPQTTHPLWRALAGIVGHIRLSSLDLALGVCTQFLIGKSVGFHLWHDLSSQKRDFSLRSLFKIARENSHHRKFIYMYPMVSSCLRAPGSSLYLKLKANESPGGRLARTNCAPLLWGNGDDCDNRGRLRSQRP